LTSALWSLFRLGPVKKEEIEAFFNIIEQFTAFIAAFTSEE
jgi:hypothetical protein